MRIITKRKRIKGVFDRWRKQYPTKKDCTEEQVKITKELSKLNLNRVGEKKIIEIIGNKTWTDLICDECQEDQDKVVRFIERYEDKYECNSCDLCLSCLKEGAKEMNAFGGNQE